MEDQLIINLFFERSEKAISELAKKYGRLCCTISYNILGSEQDAEECVNDTYLAAWNTIPPQNPNPLQAYICKIARNLSLKKYHANRAACRNNFYDVVLEEIADCLDAGNNVEDEIMAKELAKQVNEFLETLKVRDRVIFVQRYWYLTPISEIAKNLNMSSNSVTVRLHRIREKLRKYLEE